MKFNKPWMLLLLTGSILFAGVVSAENCGNIEYLLSSENDKPIPIFTSTPSNVKVKTVGICDDSNNDPRHTLEKEERGERYHIHYEIHNKGSGIAHNIEVRCYLSNDKHFGDSDDKYIAADWIDSLGAGEVLAGRKTKKENGDYIKTPADIGEYYIFLVVIVHEDDASDISDSNDQDEYANLEIKAYVPPPPPMKLWITDPVGGTWKTDRKHTINWETENIPGGTHVKIEYSVDSNNWHVLVSSTPNDGSKEWDMEDKPYSTVIKKDTDKAKIRITSVEYPKVNADSPRFKIDHKK